MTETWTRITTHLDGTAHEIQLVSGDLRQWLDILEDELELEHLRGTADGADKALAFAQQSARLAIQGDIDSFGGHGVSASSRYGCFTTQAALSRVVRTANNCQR
jgi:hypothetical protein